VAHCHLGLGKLHRRTAHREPAQEHLTIATAMYREIDLRCWLETGGPGLGSVRRERRQPQCRRRSRPVAAHDSLFRNRSGVPSESAESRAQLRMLWLPKIKLRLDDGREG